VNPDQWVDQATRVAFACHHVGGPVPGGTSITAGGDGGLGDFTWTQAVTLAGALIAASMVVLTLIINAARARRDALAALYADALGAVSDYLEGPYRILRKDGTGTTRFAITNQLSDVKSAIDHHQAMLTLQAPPHIANAYDDYVDAAKREAGRQMHDAWLKDPVNTDAGVNLGVSLPRANSVAARDRLCDLMQADQRYRWFKPWSWRQRTRAIDACVSARSASAPPSPHIAP
jgi:hypothetical protein